MLLIYFPDNTASILTKRGGFRRREQPVYRLPVLIVDSGSPALSSTNTLSVRVCDCDSDGVALSCGAVAYTATGLSTGALLAILGCIITLLGKIYVTSVSTNMLRFVEVDGVKLKVIIIVEVIFFLQLWSQFPSVCSQLRGLLPRWQWLISSSEINVGPWHCIQCTLGIRERRTNLHLTTCLFVFCLKLN